MTYDMKDANQAYQATLDAIGLDSEQIKDEIAFLIEVAIKKKLFEIRYEKVLTDELLSWLREENGYRVTTEVVNYSRPRTIYIISWENGWVEPTTEDEEGNTTPTTPVDGGGNTIYTEADLNSMDVESILALATIRGYTLEGMTAESPLADVVAAFLAAQAAANQESTTPETIYTAEQLNTMTVEEILAIAEERSYTLDGITNESPLADVVNAFLAAQGAAADNQNNG